MTKDYSIQLSKPPIGEMCPPGYHVVHGHERICKSGTATWVDTHTRKNRGRIRPGLLKENIHFLYWNTKKNMAKALALHLLAITNGTPKVKRMPTRF